MFDIDNAQYERIWAVKRGGADGKGSVKQKQKFPQKVMVWLGVCFGRNYAIGHLEIKERSTKKFILKKFFQ